MELAGRYGSSLSSIEPVKKKQFPLAPFTTGYPASSVSFSTPGNITSSRPSRPAPPIVFAYPGAKGPGF